MSKVIFITGTDTGVGKTVVTALLYADMLHRGVDVRVIKPVETGCAVGADGKLFPGDGSLYLQIGKNRQTIEETIPYMFKAPAAPTVAAAEAGLEIDYNLLVDQIKRVVETTEVLLVEGAGGLLVPITREKSFADLSKDISAQTLVVVGSRLGALNHAALTFEVLRRRELSTLGYVLNDLNAGADDRETQKVARRTNASELAEIALGYDMPCLGVLPYVSDINYAANYLKNSPFQCIRELSQRIENLR